MTIAARGDLELTVLLAIQRLDDDAYGLRVRREVGQLRQRDCAVGAIYTTLIRLEEKGLVTSRTTDPIPQRGGRSRRAYRLTGDGKRALAQARRAATRLWNLDPLGGQT
jgi:DNA-binding PadR family transcriptional regulator